MTKLKPQLSLLGIGVFAVLLLAVAVLAAGLLWMGIAVFDRERILMRWK